MNLEDLYRLLRAAHVQAQGVVDTVREPLLVLDGKLCVQGASRSFFEVFHVGRDETLGRHLHELGDGQWDVPELRRLLGEVEGRSRGETPCRLARHRDRRRRRRTAGWCWSWRTSS